MSIRSLSTHMFLTATLLLASAGQVVAGSDAPLVLVHKWPSADGVNNTYSLSVNEARVRSGLLNSKDTLSDRAVFTSVIREASKLADALSDEQIKIRVEVEGLKYVLSFNSTYPMIDEAQRRIKALESFIDDSYGRLDEVSYYRRDIKLGGLVIDHNEIVNDYLDIIEDAHRYFAGRDAGRPVIDQINERLFFLQSIPYDDMVGADFSMMTPLRMLAERRGDCESKQVFLAGLLKLRFPDKRVALISLPQREHILAALEVSENIAPITHLHEGRHYLILDATGPALVPLQHTNKLKEFWTFATTKQVWREVELATRKTS